MKDKRSLHLKVQELCDCFATTDPLREMSLVEKDTDREEGALKWIALAVLHGINANAKKITIAKARDGKVTVAAKYREAELPSPGAEVGNKVFEVVKGLTHLGEEQGRTPLALGIRESSIELAVEIEGEAGGESVTLKFPKTR